MSTREVSDVEELAMHLKCRVSKVFPTYQSLQLGTPFKARIMWGVEKGMILKDLFLQNSNIHRVETMLLRKTQSG